MSMPRNGLVQQSRGVLAAAVVAVVLLDGAGFARADPPADPLMTDARNVPPQDRLQPARAKVEQAERRWAEANRKAVEARRRSEQASRAALQARADQTDVLARPHAEAEERKAADRVVQADIEAAGAQRLLVLARRELEQLERSQTSEDRAASAEQLIENAKAADAVRKGMVEAREAEARRLSEKLRQAQERRAAAQAARSSSEPAGWQAPLHSQAPRPPGASLPAPPSARNPG